jgi:hypothetical protein
VSYASLIELGGLIVLLDVIPKKLTTKSSPLVVVIDGAANEVLVGVNAPLCESIGIDPSTPLTSSIAAAADTDEERLHV